MLEYSSKKHSYWTKPPPFYDVHVYRDAILSVIVKPSGDDWILGLGLHCIEVKDKGVDVNHILLAMIDIGYNIIATFFFL